jgi:multidrug efflux pump subunit AcrA (membrane-fusion protein)
MVRLVSLLVLLALVAAACRGEPTPAVQVEQARAAAVTETVSAPGRLAPAASAEVTAGVAGTVAAITVEDGDTVEQGDVVVRLESDDLEAALDRVEDARVALDDLALPAAPALDGLGGFDADALRPDTAALDLALPVPAPVPAVNPAADVVAELDRSVRPVLDETRSALTGLVADLHAALDELQHNLEQWSEAVGSKLPPEVAAELEPPDHELPTLPDATAVESAVDGLEASYEAARAGLLAAGEAAVEQQTAAAAALAAAADGVARQVEGAVGAAVGELAAAQSAVQQASFAALEQQAAEAAGAQAAELDAAEAQLTAQAEALTVEAPFGGVVELAAEAGDADPTGLGALGGLDAGGLGLGADGLGGLAPGGGSGGPLRIGGQVRAGQTLFTVYDTSAWYVDADIDEIDAPGVAVGQRAAVTVDAFPGAVFDGVVETLRLAASPSMTGAVVYPARVRLLDPPADPGPRVGMTASIEITTDVVDAALAVPSRALVRREGVEAVYVVREERAEIVPVTVQAVGEDLAAVDGALEVGEPVIVAGYEDLPGGAAVELE